MIAYLCSLNNNSLSLNMFVYAKYIFDHQRVSSQVCATYTHKICRIPLKSPTSLASRVPSNLPIIRQWWYTPWPTGPGRFWAPWVAAAGRRSGTWARCGRPGNQGISHQNDQQREDRPTEVWMMTWWWHEPWDLPTRVSNSILPIWRIIHGSKLVN